MRWVVDGFDDPKKSHIEDVQCCPAHYMGASVFTGDFFWHISTSELFTGLAQFRFRAGHIFGRLSASTSCSVGHTSASTYCENSTPLT